MPESCSHGRRNLILLGILAASIAFISTAVELWIYRSSGDIYLDRSRPGYLPDDKEVNETTNANSGFHFSDTGELDSKELQEYLKELKAVSGYLKRLEDPYASDSLSDESLGIAKPKDSKKK